MLLILSQTYDLKEYIPDRFTVEGVILAKGTDQVYKVRPPESLVYWTLHHKGITLETYNLPPHMVNIW